MPRAVTAPAHPHPPTTAYVARADAVLAGPAPVEVLGIDEIRRVAFGFRNATREASLISRLVLSVRAFVTFSCRK